MNLTDTQRQQGNPSITEWCRKCECRTLEHPAGACLWCDTPFRRGADIREEREAA